MLMTLKRFLTPILILPLFFVACEPEYDSPPVDSIPEGEAYTIQKLRDMYKGDPIKFEEDKSLYGVITMDERSGNLYKSVYMKDHTGAINLSLQYGGGLYEGDSVRINLNGCVLTDYNGLVQLDSLDVDANVVKQATNVDLTPEPVSLGQLDSSYQSKLVKVKNVEFHPVHRGVNFSNASEQQALNRTVLDCKGNSLIMRTSGYADFADQKTPTGHGSMVAVVSQFQETLQLLLRRPEELNMDDRPCTVVAKDFDRGDINSGGWTAKSVIGSQTWSLNDQGSNSMYAAITGFANNQTNKNEDWLISPAFDASSASHELNFRNAKSYTGPDMKLMVSTDYSGSGDPNNANWNSLSYNKSSGSFTWKQGGPVDLSGYNATETYIAFKYTCTGSDAATWEVDDVIIAEK